MWLSPSLVAFKVGVMTLQKWHIYRARQFDKKQDYAICGLNILPHYLCGCHRGWLHFKCFQVGVMTWRMCGTFRARQFYKNKTWRFMVLTCDPILYAAVTEAGCILSGSYDLANVTHLPGKAIKKNKTSRFVVLTCDPSISVAVTEAGCISSVFKWGLWLGECVAHSGQGNFIKTRLGDLWS
jgi:hypothetical protein